MASGYVSMPLAPGWLLERHLGWTLVAGRDGLKLLARRRGPLLQLLLLTLGPHDLPELEGLLRRARFAPWRSTLVWNDFSDDGQEPSRRLSGVRLPRAERGRWFGVGSFVVDLSCPPAELLARMASRERGAVRRAAALGVAGDVRAEPTLAQLEEFLELYRPMARERGLELPGLGTLARISAAGDLWLACVRSPAGGAFIANLVYRRDDKAFFLYGARSRAAPGWAGPAAQWATFGALQAAGVRWYDLGQVASCDPHDGIYRFKSALGGAFVPHGAEYRHQGALVRLALGLRRVVRA